MNRECRYAQEAIWDSARTGSRLPDEIQTHITECDSCRQAHNEAAMLASALANAGCVPAAPDCRSAVMARIASSVPIYRRAWVYACAFAVITVGLGVIILSPKPSQRMPLVADNNVIKQTIPNVPHTVRKEVPRVAVTPIHKPNSILVKKTPKLASIPKKAVPRTIKRSKPVFVQKPETPVPEMPKPPSGRVLRPIAVAEVSWPDPNNQKQDEYSYSYREKDEKTGIVTNCSVKRSGDSLEMYMEAEPTSDQSPRKGSINYETNPNA